MQTMTPTWPAPDITPPPPAPKKKTHKGLIILGVLVVLGVIGAVANANDEARSKATMDRAITNSLVNNTTGGGLDETGYVRDNCASSLDMDLPGVGETIRQGLANGDTTTASLADSYAQGYYDKDGGAGTDLSRSEIVAACAAGLRNG
jgi:hypothetical protein